jgi:YidC/Oxa1 family membrane protein insertase
VLNSFNRTQTGFGRLGLTVEENRSLGNYVFSATDVGHFLDAHLFGAPLGASMIQTVGLGAFEEFNRSAVIAVGVPLMILAGVATHFNSRASVARQSIEAAANPQTAMMNKLALYFFPLGVVVGGPFLPLAVILYWVANNIWTYGQQHYVFGRIEKEEELKKEEELARRASNAPAPGSKPKAKRKRPPTAGSVAAAKATPATELTEHSGQEIDAVDVDSAEAGDKPVTAAGAASSANGKPATPKAGSAANRAPRRPNTRPKKRRP